MQDRARSRSRSPAYPLSRSPSPSNLATSSLVAGGQLKDIFPFLMTRSTFAISSRRQLRDSRPAAHAFIHEIVVPPWPVILWVAFRVFGGQQPSAFLDLLQDPDNRDIVVWEPEDALYLFRLLTSYNNPSSGGWSLYSAWRQHMLEISLPEWSSICAMTRVELRSRTGNHGMESLSELKHRLCTFILLLSPDKFVVPTDIFKPLGIQTDQEPFYLVAQIINDRGSQHLDLMRSWMAPSPSEEAPEKSQVNARFDSIDFWSVTNLEGWLSKHGHQVCYAALPKSGASLLQWVEYLPTLARCTISQHLVAYTLATLLQRSAKERELEAFLQIVTDWANQTEFQCIIAYPSFVLTMVDFLKRSYNEPHSVDFHSISTQVCARLKDDIFIVTARLVRLFEYQERRKEFLAFRGADAQKLLDLLQNILDHDQSLVVRPRLFEALSRLSSDSGLHPTCFALSGIQKIGHQVAAGGFGDVWKGVISGQSICVKVMRLFKECDVQALLKEFGHEALIWRQLCHPNLLPFYGLYYLESRLCIISPWMENGNILDYVKSTKPTVDRCLSWILDIALGVEYLHKNRIVHGDLKAINILVTPSHRACIVDLGLSALAESITLRFTQTTTRVRGGTMRYQAPELLKSEKQNHYGSDVYAFAHVCYEILTGNIPFYETCNDAVVMFKILGGCRPERIASCRGSRVLDALWDLLQSCWQEDFKERPRIEDIVLQLVGSSINPSNTQSSTDWDERFSSKFRRSLTDSLLPSVARMECMIFGDQEVLEYRVRCSRAHGPGIHELSTLSS
ncbi:kinase-like domain-containing protein [Roridomyces roridus]|uniref:Kinase-like domain-containing protein n=1 Tax=Roridomyces roridus TaxID=1738132 RepID=A0AAD7BI29_9AGAR|nr:kinase-like domain-containing protein [Roridomyces roridus]